VETEPVNLLSVEYRDGSGYARTRSSITKGPHDRRYAILAASNFATDRRASCCSTVPRYGRLEIPDWVKVGGTLMVTIHVHGYYLQSGREFSGTTKVALPLTE
jgi:hypothetical protein